MRSDYIDVLSEVFLCVLALLVRPRTQTGVSGLWRSGLRLSGLWPSGLRPFALRRSSLPVRQPKMHFVDVKRENKRHMCHKCHAPEKKACYYWTKWHYTAFLNERSMCH